MNKNKMLIVSIATLAALVGCGRQETPSTSATNETPVSNVADATTSQTGGISSEVATNGTVSTSEVVTSNTVSTSEVVADNSFATALEAAKKLGDNEYSATKYTVTAYIVDEKPYIKSGKGYVSASFLIAATADGTETMKVFNANLPDGVTTVSKGQKIVIEGYLENYVKDGASTLEITGKTDERYYAKVISIEGTGTVTPTPTPTPTPVGSNKMTISISSNVEMDETSNYASQLGFDATILNIKSKSGSGVSSENGQAYTNKNLIHSKNKEVRVYTNGSLTFTSNKTIASIKITYNGSGNDGATVKVDGSSVEGTTDFTINSSSFTIENNKEKGQVRFTGLEITFAA